MARVANRVQVAVSGTPGTGAVTLGSAVSGAQTFASAGITDGEPVEYLITDGAAWELGVGVYASTGPTLTRVSIRESTSAGAAISATSAALVSIVAPAESAVMPQIRPLPGAYLLPPYISGSTGTRTVTSGQIVAIPMWVHGVVAITTLGAYVTTAGTGLIRVGLYADATSGASRPGMLLADSGSIADTSAGIKEATVSAVTMRPGVLYWIVYQSNNSTVTLRGLNTTRLLGMASPAAASYTSQFLQRSGTFGALSSDESGQTYALLDTSSCALVWVRQ